MTPNRNEPQTGRETRLLVLVVGVAIIVLLLLAQWQFPAAGLSGVTQTTASLAGLAARATFDEMASTMADVVGRVSPMMLVVPLERLPGVDEAPPRVVASRAAAPVSPAAPAAASETGDETAPAPTAPDGWTLALRVRRDVAVVHVPAGFSLRSGESAFDVVSFDAEREMAFLRVRESSTEPDTLSASIRTFPSFSYVAIVDATPVGPTVQPAFVGRGDTLVDPRWSHALVPASAVPGLSAGGFVFSLDSRLIGLAVRGEAGAMIVPAPALEALVQGVETPPEAAP